MWPLAAPGTSIGRESETGQADSTLHTLSQTSYIPIFHVRNGISLIQMFAYYI